MKVFKTAFLSHTYFTSDIPTATLLHKCNQPITGSQRIQLYIRPVTVEVVCSILSSPEILLQWAAPHLTLTPDFSRIRLKLYKIENIIRFLSILVNILLWVNIQNLYYEKS